MSLGQHSFVCCDLDHGSSSKQPSPSSPCPFEAYCCLDQHCSPTPCAEACNTACPESCEPCPETCIAEPCTDACTSDSCTQPCSGQDCQPCLDPTCEPDPSAWCPPGCTIEEYIQRCTDAACTLPQVEIDPLALLAQQPLNQHYFDLLAQVLGNGNTTSNNAPAPAPAAPAPPPPQLAHVCHWQNCHRSFESMPILLAHIASDHLSAPGYDTTAQASVTQAAPPAAKPTPPMDNFGALATQQQQQQQNNAHSDVFSCLWDDCFPFGVGLDANTATQPPSHASSNVHTPVQDNSPAHAAMQAVHNQAHANGHGHVSAHPHSHGELSPQTMLRHLLEDHLGVANLLQANADAHAHLVLTHTHANAHPHHGGCATGAPHDAHANAHSHHALGPHHHHPVSVGPVGVKLPPTPSPTPPGSETQHICLWPGCTVREPFASAGDLMEHLSEAHIGRGRDSYRCHWDGCGGPDGRLFSSRQKVLRHLQSHTGHRPYVCSVCGQSFSEAAPLAAHMRRHADDKPFVCDHPGCGKAFAISSSLTIHKRTHNGDRPFVCPHCDKGFVEASNLTKHIRTHTGERPFACSHPGCGRRFSRPDQLKRHALVHDAAHKGRLAAKARA